MVVALISILVVSAAIGVAYQSTDVAARLSDRSRDFQGAKVTAEGILEYGYGVWKQRVHNQDRALSTTECAVTPPPLGTASGSPKSYYYDYAPATVQGPLTIQATDVYGAPMSSTSATPAPAVVSLANYPGWRGNSYNYVASVRVSMLNPLNGKTLFTAGARRHFQYVDVPLFQAMFFYEHNLEMYRPAPMIVSGLVHTNSDLYLSTGTANSLTFQSYESYVGHYYETTAPYGAEAWNGGPSTMYPPTYPNGGSSAQVHQVDRYEPLGKDASTVLNTSDTNPNNDSFREIIEPPDTNFTDPPEIAKRRIYNQAGIIVTINGSTTTVSTGNGTTLTSSQVTSIKNAITSKSSAIYDQREGRYVDTQTVNIATLTPIFNAASGFNGVLYIQDTTTGTNPKTVKLINGGVLPDAGLTVASQNPVYVQGDYNTGTVSNSTSVPSNVGNNDNTASPVVAGYTRKPAAVMGDAVMLLSNAWSDSNSSKSLSNRDASNTTYNMAILAGQLPSGYTPSTTDVHYTRGMSPYGYSGGANNYPRFLEDWSGNYCTYYGSMVELFQSKIFTGKWDTGSIYGAPTRRWNFDTNFTTTPPRGSLDAVTITRGSWQKF